MPVPERLSSSFWKHSRISLSMSSVVKHLYLNSSNSRSTFWDFSSLSSWTMLSCDCTKKDEMPEATIIEFISSSCLTCALLHPFPLTFSKRLLNFNTAASILLLASLMCSSFSVAPLHASLISFKKFFTRSRRQIDSLAFFSSDCKRTVSFSAFSSCVVLSCSCL